MDAANVDLKGFTDEFYVKLTGAQLAPVLDTLAWTSSTRPTSGSRSRRCSSRARTTPTRRSRRECRWIARELGPDVPLHFTAFHPDFKMTRRRSRRPPPRSSARATHRAGRGAALRLHGQRPRPRGRDDLLPGVRRGAHRARLAPHRGVPAHAGRALPRLRHRRSPGASRRSTRSGSSAGAASRCLKANGSGPEAGLEAAAPLRVLLVQLPVLLDQHLVEREPLRR